MSTFGGGSAFLIEVKTLEASNVAAGTKYTVPAGRYAVVNVLSGAGILGRYNFAAVNVTFSIGASRIDTNGTLLNEGDQLFTSSTETYYVFIREFKLP